MTTFVLEVDCSKAAFGPGGKPTAWRDADRALEVSRILREVADRISREPPGDDARLNLFDGNGNLVGSAVFTGAQ